MFNKMNIELIKTIVVETIECRTGCKITHISNYTKKALLGTEMHIVPRDLVLIVLDLERTFKIQFTEYDLLIKKLETVDSIVEIIYEQISGIYASTVD